MRQKFRYIDAPFLFPARSEPLSDRKTDSFSFLSGLIHDSYTHIVEF
jgi:hypothetical protein